MITDFTSSTPHNADSFNSRYDSIDASLTAIKNAITNLLSTNPAPSIPTDTWTAQTTSLESTIATKTSNLNAQLTTSNAQIATHNTNTTNRNNLQTAIDSLNVSVNSKLLGVGVVDKRTLPAAFINLTTLTFRANKMVRIASDSTLYQDLASSKPNVRCQFFSTAATSASGTAFSTPNSSDWLLYSQSQMHTSIKDWFGATQSSFSGGVATLPDGLWVGLGVSGCLSQAASARYVISSIQTASTLMRASTLTDGISSLSCFGGYASWTSGTQTSWVDHSYGTPYNSSTRSRVLTTGQQEIASTAALMRYCPSLT